MRSVLVVIGQPVVGDLLDVSECVEQVRVEHFLAEAAVEPLDERVLVRLAGPDVQQLHAVGLGPIDGAMRVLISKMIQPHAPDAEGKERPERRREPAFGGWFAGRSGG